MIKSPLIVYSSIYSILFLLAILFDYILEPWISSPLVRLSILDIYVTIILYIIGNFFFQSNNIYDLHWPLLPLICSICFYLTTNTIDDLSLKSISLIGLIFLWSRHLIWQTLTSSNDIHHEDWRYQTFREQYKNQFLLFAFVALHLLPMIIVLIGSSSIYYIFLHTSKGDRLTLNESLCLLLMFIGIVLEYVADRQLTQFRQLKRKSREHRFAVLCTGLWGYTRHPNYLGELMFWWSLFALGYFHRAPWWTIFSPLLTTVLMLFGSIPMSEDRMYRKYPDYKFVQQTISKLVPTFGLFE